MTDLQKRMPTLWHKLKLWRLGDGYIATLNQSSAEAIISEAESVLAENERARELLDIAWKSLNVLKSNDRIEKEEIENFVKEIKAYLAERKEGK